MAGWNKSASETAEIMREYYPDAMVEREPPDCAKEGVSSYSMQFHPKDKDDILNYYGKPPEEFLAWLAGYIEGEGGLFIRREEDGDSYTKNTLHITQAGDNGKEQLEWINEQLYHVFTITENKPPEDKPNWSDTFILQLGHPEAIRVILRWIEPHLDPHTKLREPMDRLGV